MLELSALSASFGSESGCPESFQQFIAARGRSSQTVGSMTDQPPASREDTASVRAFVASTPAQIWEARRLVRERYGWRGYAVSDERESRDDDAVILVARENTITVGTLTVGFDGPLGLCVDESYPDELRSARLKGGCVCELTRLALIEQADSRTVLSVLFGLAYAVGALVRGVTDVFIEVNPRHANFYRRVMGFVVESGERWCKRVQAPAVLLRLSVDELQARLEARISLGVPRIGEPGAACLSCG
jgi:N-acyl amino acid synthase FeeM